MASSQYIAPFPENLDRAHFASWLSGFSDGEASFYLGWLRNGSSIYSGSAYFVLSLRQDDRLILERIQSFWGCGRILNIRANASVPNACPTTTYRVADSNDLMRVVVPHFERFPLMAKKAADFWIWKQGVELLAMVKQRPLRGGGPGTCGHLRRWTRQERIDFQAMVEAIRAQRRFNPPPPSPIAITKKLDQPLLLFSD